ncbi:MAG TPA: hypothetical protein VMQ76_01670 [Terracidiphilus sp.]|nr:hypothetical protein [Terracidiphilus sp.]
MSDYFDQRQARSLAIAQQQYDCQLPPCDDDDEDDNNSGCCHQWRACRGEGSDGERFIQCVKCGEGREL